MVTVKSFNSKKITPLRKNHNTNALASEDNLAQCWTTSAARLFKHLV